MDSPRNNAKKARQSVPSVIRFLVPPHTETIVVRMTSTADKTAAAASTKDDVKIFKIPSTSPTDKKKKNSDAKKQEDDEEAVFQPPPPPPTFDDDDAQYPDSSQSLTIEDKE